MIVLLMLFLAPFLLSPFAQAQLPATAPVVAHPPIMGGINLGAFKIPAIKSEPYSLISKTTSSKKLVDGTWTTTVHEERDMRDSEGRQRVENMDSSGEVLDVRITDPVAQTIAYLEPWNKTARVMHIPLPVPPTPEQEARAAEARAKGKLPPSFTAPNLPPLRSKLPPQTISGVSTEGERTIITLRGTTLENGEAVGAVTDTWTAPDLHIPLARTTDDPRGQKIAMTVSGLQRAEPDPALFKIPTDYKVTEQHN